uniref:Glycoside hydrolase family 43 protein n=1 Tax=termite gut metagenome TaxID=433724 RepID=S0DFD1_9ZZZZ
MIKNPVLSGFHADPSLLYVDGVFYTANSTFEYFPGVVVSASKDLANWETVSLPLNEPRLLHMEGNPKSCGIWAPCLTYCDGLFYLVYTDVKYWSAPYKDSPNYITTAKDIRGPWSDPVFVNCSGFDPSLFHDDDGRKYFVSMEWDYRKYDPDPAKEATQFTGILITELDPVALTPVAEPVKVFKGSKLGLVEGPHLYKKDGFYYLFAAEGGTAYNHAETVCRAKSVYGEYVMHPNTHLTCTANAPDAPLQKTGHGAMVQSNDGRWWFAFLCGRPLPGTRFCPLGRETAINELIWKEGWPYLKNGTMIPDQYFEGYGEQKPPEAVAYDFKSERFFLDFQFLRSKPKYSIEADGALRLWGGNSPCCNFGQGAFLRRQTDFSFEAAMSFKLTAGHFQQMAGLMYRYDETNHVFLRAAYDKEENKSTLAILCQDAGKFSIPVEIEIPDAFATIYLKLTVSGKSGYFSYSPDGVSYAKLHYEIDVTKLSDEYGGLGFTGAFVGMQSVDMRDKTSFADFYGFEYIPR